MKNSLKVPLISAMFATMPLNSNAEFSNNRNDCVNSINTSLFENLKTFGTGITEGIVIFKFFKNFFPKIYPP